MSRARGTHVHPKFRKVRHRLLQMFAPQRLTWEESFRPSWVVGGRGGFAAGPRTYWFGDASFMAWKQEDSITIGSYCSIASGVCMIAGGNHLVDSISTYPFTMIDRWREWSGEPQEVQQIRIGNDVWIGARASVVGNVAIGDGAVIGAGALVVRDIPPYSVAVGVPARPVRQRFSDEEIETLQSVRWWTWPEDSVLRAEGLLRGNDVSALKAFAEREGLLSSNAGGLKAGA